MSEEITFDKEADALGITSSVFPNGRSTCKRNENKEDKGVTCNDTECGCFQDKLQEFVEYQLPQSYLDTAFDLGVPLDSTDGMTMFKEAVHSEYMECYYTIGQNIEHQLENTCSITSLVVALNSLAIDPARATWYGEFRWHYLGSLACCTPRLQKNNVKLDQYACLAVCNDTLAYPVQADGDWTLDKVRSWVKFITTRSDIVMITNFGRKPMHQIGIGHFMPIAGYHEGRDMVLMLDIAKEKYHSYWVKLSVLEGAMRDPDTSRTGESRGFVLLTRPDYDPAERLFSPSLLLRVDDYSGQVDPSLKSFMAIWNRWLKTEIPLSSSIQEILPMAIRKFISSIQETIRSDKFSLLELTPIHFRCNCSNNHTSIFARCRKPHCQATCHSYWFRHQLESLEIFKIVQSCLESLANEDLSRVLDLVVCDLDDIDQAVTYAKSRENILEAQMVKLARSLKDEKHEKETMIHQSQKTDSSMQECPGYVEFFPEHILSFVFLSWPFMKESIDTISKLRNYILHDAEFDFNPSCDEATDLYGVLLKLFGIINQNIEKPKINHADNLTSNLRIQLVVEDAKTTVEKLTINGFYDNAQDRNCFVTMASFLDGIMRSQLLELSNPRYLKHHVKAMKRKFNVIFQYHQLL